MALFEIKHRFTGAVLFSLETKNMRLCVEAAVGSGADLAGADLAGAYLAGADLAGAEISNNITVTKAPIQIHGLAWPVTIWDAHMQIGCEFHSHDEWAAFTEADWIRMGGKPAALMLRNEYPAIKLLCERHAVKPEQEAT